jgi:L-threonylcarbamoyladenylate synthase
MERLERAAALLMRGGVIVYPTETFYGLGAHPRSEKTIERVYRIKGRGFDKPLPLIASDIVAVRAAVAAWPEVAERLAAVFWPGPLTLLLPASPCLPLSLHAGTGNLAIRISPHPVARELAERAGGLLISTSANRSGDPACRRVDEIPCELTERVDLVVDGGELPGGLPSTIVSVAPAGLELVRAGCIPFEDVLGVGRL